MKLLIVFLLSMYPASIFALETNCQTYSIRCDCFPAVPFEGFKLHIVEKCDDKEEWSTEYDAPAFETEQQCREATTTDPVCKSLY